MGFGFGLIYVFGAYFLAGYTAFLSVSAFFKGKGSSNFGTGAYRLITLPSKT